VAEFDKYQKGCGGFSMLRRYKRALAKVNEALAANN